MLSRTLLSVALATASSAHFVLDYPPTAGFIDDDEGTGPCGGATVTVNSSSPQVQVDRFAVQILSTHPEGQWQFRGTLDTQEPYNWTDLTPVINTTGLGTFCLNYMYAPSEFAGNAGIIQVTDNSVDGTLYQCAPVNFVTGSNSTLGPSCTNATAFTATWTGEEALSGNASESASASSTASMSGMDHSSTGSVTSSPSATAAATSSSSSAAAAAMNTMGAGGLVAGLGAIAAGLVL